MRSTQTYVYFVYSIYLLLLPFQRFITGYVEAPFIFRMTLQHINNIFRFIR